MSGRGVGILKNTTNSRRISPLEDPFAGEVIEWFTRRTANFDLAFMPYRKWGISGKKTPVGWHCKVDDKYTWPESSAQ
jgi:hypothetical protein